MARTDRAGPQSTPAAVVAHHRRPAVADAPLATTEAGLQRLQRLAGHAAVQRLVAAQRRPEPFIKRVTVHLTPPQSAELEWQGTPPADAPGRDTFMVSTGKGYSNAGDPPGTCTRECCTDPYTQCAPPYNRPDRVGSCCTFYGNTFWTGVPREEHNSFKYWTPIQPHHSARGIALHSHPIVTGQPIGHGCVRMEEANAERIALFSNGRRTNVTIDGRAAPVECDEFEQCDLKGKRKPPHPDLEPFPTAPRSGAEGEADSRL